jgi:phosphatidylethanolamine-binding protein
MLGTLTQLTGKSYAVIMVDMDIPTNNPPATNTLLHWMQTGFTPATTSTTLNTTNGVQQVFLLNQGNTAALASYLGPSPPARLPLSHRYTQILVDTSSITAQQTSTLQSAAQSRQGFNANTVLTSANLVDKVVAGNSFNVTNPGPAQNSVAGTGTGNETGSTSSTGATSSTTATFRGDAGVTVPSGGMVFGLLAAGAVFLGL